MIFYTSDLHFGHKNVIQYCGRPWPDIVAMQEGLIERWNETVGPNDTVYILGDLFFCGKTRGKEILARLNGSKRLVLGNHDWGKYKADKTYEGLTEVSSHTVIMRSDGLKWLLSHFPYKDAGDHTPGEERYADHRLVDEGLWLLHGHVHNAWKVKDRMINVGVDVWDYRPVPESKIAEIILNAKGTAASG